MLATSISEQHKMKVETSPRMRYQQNVRARLGPDPFLQSLNLFELELQVQSFLEFFAKQMASLR